MKIKGIVLGINALVLLITSSCKKGNEIEVDSIPSTGTRTELTLDSIYLYAKEVYLWNDVLPNYKSFSPRINYSNLSPEFSAVNRALFDLSMYKINAITGLGYEYTGRGIPKYSFIENSWPSIQFKTELRTNRSLYTDDVYIFGNSDKVAYAAVHTFPQLHEVKTDLDEMFNLISKTMSETLVLDLRYNRGGYIETAQYLANLIAPNKLNGKLMYQESFNQTLQVGNVKVLKHQLYLDDAGNPIRFNGKWATMADVDYSESGNTHYFKKTGGIEHLKKLYVITSDLTASASELLISVLKPYLEVKLVGEKTFGKPVGTFPIVIDKYNVYFASFLIKNSGGWSDYFDGMIPDIPVDLGEDPQLGTPEEPALKAIIEDLQRPDLRSVNRQKLQNSRIGIVPSINFIDSERGCIESRLKLKNNNH